MRLNVRSLLSEPAGDLIPVEIDPNDQISGLKILLHDRYSEIFPEPEAFMLVRGYVLLEDVNTFVQYGVVEDDTISAVHDVLYGNNFFDLVDCGAEANTTEKDANHTVNATHVNASQASPTLATPASPAQTAHGPTYKLMVPPDFQGEQELAGFNIHRMKKSGHLQSKIDSRPPKWLSKVEAYALLSNHAIFSNGEIEDLAAGNRVDGLCGIFEYHASSSDTQFTEYDTLKSSSEEKWRPQLQISEGVSLNRNEISGNVWIRRRLSLPEHPRYQLLQWKERGTKQTGEAVEIAEGAHIRTRNGRTMDSEITQQLTEMKTLLREFSQSVSAQLLAMSTKIQSLQETNDKILELLNEPSPSKVPSPSPASTSQQHPTPASTSQQHLTPASTSQQHPLPASTSQQYSVPQLHPGSQIATPSSPAADQA